MGLPRGEGEGRGLRRGTLVRGREMAGGRRGGEGERRGGRGGGDEGSEEGSKGGAGKGGEGVPARGKSRARLLA